MAKRKAVKPMIIEQPEPTPEKYAEPVVVPYYRAKQCPKCKTWKTVLTKTEGKLQTRRCKCCAYQYKNPIPKTG